MPTIEPCVYCGRLCTDGFCSCRWPAVEASVYDNDVSVLKGKRKMPEDLKQENIALRMQIENLMSAITETTDAVDASGARKKATLRAHYDAVYMAAMGGGLMTCGVGESWDSLESPINYCHSIALESVRTHAARMAEREAVIAGVVAI